MTEHEEFETWKQSQIIEFNNEGDVESYFIRHSYAMFEAWKACAELKDQRIIDLEEQLKTARNDALEEVIFAHQWLNTDDGAWLAKSIRCMKEE